jgi:hypothetical protein
MSKMTEKFSTSSAAQMARAEYEKQQRSTLPSIIVSLASGGKIYPKDHVLREGKIEMRYMTAYDEDILTNLSYIREGVMIDKLLESISLTKFNVSDLSSYDKDALLLYIRILSYGSEYDVTVTDPETKNEISRTVQLDKIKPKSFTLIPDDQGEFEYKTETDVIKFKYNVADISDKSPSEFSKMVITQVNDSRSADHIEQFVRYKFMARDSRNFRKYYAENAPGLDFTVEFEGERGGTFTARFPIGADFFWV